MSKNITLSVDDRVLDQIKILAAKRRTTVSGLVRSYFDSLVASDQAVDLARESLLRLAREKAGDMGSQGWKREDLYDR